MIQALVEDRDNKIQEIGLLTNKNIEIINSIDTAVDYDKIKNFETELKKVISGVKETGIHIKELQKIRYDFEEVVLGNNPQDGRQTHDETVERYEFVMLGADSLKELARKLGSFKVREIPLSFYETGVDTGGYLYKNTRNKDSFRKDNIPTFGKGLDERKSTKEKKRSTSISHFKKHARNSNRENKKAKLVMSDMLVNDREGNPIEPIPPSCVSYIKNSSNRSKQYSTIDKDDKRSKSIETTAFRDVGNTYLNKEYKNASREPFMKDYKPKYMDYYDPGVGSPVNIIYDNNSFKDMNARMHMTSMQHLNSEDFKNKLMQEPKRAKMKFGKSTQY